MHWKFLSRKFIYRAFATQKHEYQGVVGLEVHAQICSKSKLFSPAPVLFNAPVNSCVDDFDAAIPGTLPVLNRFCVEAAVKTALALTCDINKVSTFDRKHYFYADLPAGYQITQQRNPIAKNGYLEFPMLHQKKLIEKRSKLIQLQLEQDSGKSLHDEIEHKVLIDLNRAGAPLMEFVFAPDLQNGEEAAALVKELCLVLTKLNVCSCKMEEGALRVDANISVHKKGEPFGTRTEVKNIGSISGVHHAVNYEINRQIESISKGQKIVNETRNWDAVKRVTIPMRDKEVVQDYRFMPEPNLLPLHLATDISEDPDLVNIPKIKKTLPELPKDTRERMSREYNLPKETVFLIVDDHDLCKLFESIMQANKSRKSLLVANLLINELRTVCNKKKCDLSTINVSSSQIGQVADCLQSELINNNFTERIFEALSELSEDVLVEDLVRERNWQQILDETVIETVCKEIVEKNPKLVKMFQSGKEKLFYGLLGQVAKAEDSRLNMAKASAILKNLLKK